MLKDDFSSEDRFQDEVCNQQIEKITYLENLIKIEEKKLFKAMKEAKKHGRL